MDALKDRLLKLEGTLRTLQEGFERDLRIARELQKHLMPNRTPEIPGLTSFARYISAQQVHSESFDLLPSKDNRELWIIFSWAETFGLSSVLLQALVRLQSEALVRAKTGVSPADIFNEVSISLSSARKAGAYRLMVAKLDLASLELLGYSAGLPPWLRRQKSTRGFGAWDFVQASQLSPTRLAPADSAAPRLAAQADAFAFHLQPGTRVYFLSPGWSQSSDVGTWSQALKLPQIEASDTDLLTDMNALLVNAQEQLKATKQEADLTALAFEVDPRKLHLA